MSKFAPANIITGIVSGELPGLADLASAAVPHHHSSHHHSDSIRFARRGGLTMSDAVPEPVHGRSARRASGVEQQQPSSSHHRSSRRGKSDLEKGLDIAEPFVKNGLDWWDKSAGNADAAAQRDAARSGKVEGLNEQEGRLRQATMRAGASRGGISTETRVALLPMDPNPDTAGTNFAGLSEQYQKVQERVSKALDNMGSVPPEVLAKQPNLTSLAGKYPTKYDAFQAYLNLYENFASTLEACATGKADRSSARAAGAIDGKLDKIDEKRGALQRQGELDDAKADSRQGKTDRRAIKRGARDILDIVRDSAD